MSLLSSHSSLIRWFSYSTKSISRGWMEAVDGSICVPLEDSMLSANVTLRCIPILQSVKGEGLIRDL